MSSGIFTSYYNGLVVNALKEANAIQQPLLYSILVNIDQFNSYYAGGSLCIDVGKRVLVVNLDETCCFLDNPLSKRLMSLDNVKLAFSIYFQEKDVTQHYEDALNKSCLRHYGLVRTLNFIND